MKKLIERCKKIYNKETPLKIEWIVAILIAIIMMLMFCYIDFKSLTVWSTNILDCIAKGDVTDYYSYTALNKYNLQHKYVSGTLYSLILWAIWNIPIWGIQYFAGKSIVKNSILLIWSKLFLVLSLGITLFITYKICKELFKDNKKSLWITFLSATFIYTYIGVFYAGQNDIMICMFAVMGLYYLIKGKNTWFYILSSVAISIKYFYLIPYIPIILLTEKKVWKIILKLGVGVAPISIFKLLVRNFPMYAISETANYSDNILKGFLGSGLKVANGVTLSFFILSFIIVCFIAYIIKPKTKEIRNNYIFYFAVAPIVLMFMFSTKYEFYRPILLMPALMILYGFKPQLFRINVILDTVAFGSCFMFSLIHEKYLFNSKYSMNGSLISKVFDVKKMGIVNLKDPLRDFLGNNINMIETMIATILFATLGIILIINYPKLNIIKKEKENDNLEKPERWIIWIRSLMVVPAIAFLLFNVIRG